MLFGAAAQRQTIQAEEEEEEESRTNSVLDNDNPERDELLELRDDSEPLDILKWELTALKLGRDLDGRQNEVSTGRVNSFKKSMVAEFDVLKRNSQKPGPCKPKDDDDKLKENKHAEKSGLVQPENGTADNPIPATRSLDNGSTSSTSSTSSSDEKKWKPPTTRRVTRPMTRPNSARKPPLPPRAKLTPATPSNTKIVHESIASLYRQSRVPVESSNLESSRRHIYDKPIVINSVDREPANYDEPIILHSADLEDREPILVDSVEDDYDSVTIDTLVGNKKHILREERIISPCQNSSIVKSAYALDDDSGLESAWPEELTVTSEVPRSQPTLASDRGELGSAIVVVPDHVDLSQMDADELEAEYARLVDEKRGKKKTKPSLPAKNERQEPVVVAEVKETELAVNNGPAPVIAQAIPKRKKLDVIREKSVVSDAESNEEQDATGPEEKEQEPKSPQIIHLEEDVEEEDDEGDDEYDEDDDDDGDDDDDDDDDDEEGEGDEFDEPILANEPSGSLPRITSVGQEPPETLIQRSSLDQIFVSYSDNAEEDAEEDLEDNLEDEEEGTDSGYATAGEHFMRDFVPDIDDSRNSRKKQARVEYDFPSIEKVVSDYFGAKNRLTDERTRTEASGSFKSSIFAHAGGCCIGIL